MPLPFQLSHWSVGTRLYVVYSSASCVRQHVVLACPPRCAVAQQQQRRQCTPYVGTQHAGRPDTQDLLWRLLLVHAIAKLKCLLSGSDSACPVAASL